MAVPSPERQIEFLSNLQRLLSEGLFVATYKYALLMALADLRPDLIVVATHGRTRLSRTLLGSMAERVIRHAPCPVLAVRR